MGRNGSGSSNFCGLKQYGTGCTNGFFLESVTSRVLAFDRSGDRTRNPSGTPDH